ncbi:MAG: hypothetical protein M1829_001164 [Trizodia sp. TS-e1964]|nr:MAG: hypothetical protein M1829_001164 [Trizodia sp. TS-e1964]
MDTPSCDRVSNLALRHDTSIIVSSLLAAFNSGSEILRRARSHRRERQLTALPSDAERKLSRSLIYGKQEIRQEYARGVERLGALYAEGDVIAKTSLAETLLKLNAGLGDAISSCLVKNLDIQREYITLTRISNASRCEVLDTLVLLCQRLSRSSIALPHTGYHRPRSHAPLLNSHKAFATPNMPSREGSRSAKPISSKSPSRKPFKANIAPKAPNMRPAAAATPKESKHLCPKIPQKRGEWTRRKKSSALAPSTVRLNKIRASATGKEPNGRASYAERANSTRSDECREDPEIFYNPRAAQLTKTFKSPQNVAPQTPGTRHTARAPCLPLHSGDADSLSIPPNKPHTQSTQQGLGIYSPPRRRAKKDTPSFLSFASDSTKLGEIHHGRWETAEKHTAFPTVTTTEVLSGGGAMWEDTNTMKRNGQIVEVGRKFRPWKGKLLRKLFRRSENRELLCQNSN